MWHMRGQCPLPQGSWPAFSSFFLKEEKKGFRGLPAQRAPSPQRL